MDRSDEKAKIRRTITPRPSRIKARAKAEQ